MLKRIVVLCLICATVLCCTACGKKPYDIIEVDGKHYMSFNTYLLGESAISDIGRYAGVSLQFTSIAQMKKKFESGAFNDNELHALQLKCMANFGTVEICDLDNLYDVRMPEDVTLRQVNWEGIRYSFSLDSQFAASCTVGCETSKNYSHLLLTEYELAPYNTNGYDFQEVKSYDPDGIQLFYRTDHAEYKIIKYEIHDENRTLYVTESYRLVSYKNISKTSSTVPHLIYMLTEENGAFVSVRIYDPIERPSVEWLSSFGLTPYEG